MADGKVVKLDGEFEEITGETEVTTRRVKERGKVLAPKFPTVVNIKQWHNQLARNLVLASGRADGQKVKWLNEVYQTGAKFEGLNSSGDARFATLDIKLHSARTAMIKEGNRTWPHSRAPPSTRATY